MSFRVLVIALFLSLAVTGPESLSQSKAPRSTGPPSWTAHVSKSEMTDTIDVTLTLDAVETIPGPAGPVRPFLIIQCIEGYFDVWFHSQMVLDSDIDGVADLRVRWDERPPESHRWERSTSFKSLNSPKSITFVKEGLLKSKKLLIEFHPHDSGPRVATFTVEGLDRHIPKLVESCPYASVLLPPSGKAEQGMKDG